MSLHVQMICIYLILIVAVQDIKCKRSEKEKTQDSITPKQSRGIGISAWGLVILILTLILLGVVAYYVALFYPMICKKQRKYNRIELATV